MYKRFHIMVTAVKFQCHLYPFSDIKLLQGLLKVMAECDDKDILVPSISL